MKFKNLPQILNICGYAFFIISVVMLVSKIVMLLRSQDDMFFIVDVVLNNVSTAIAGLVFIGFSRFFSQVIRLEESNNDAELAQEDTAINEVD